MLRKPANEQVVLIATGSEVGVALAAAALLAEEGIAARVVSRALHGGLYERQDDGLPQPR